MPRDLEPYLIAGSIDKIVPVQSVNSYEDTVSMLTQAEDVAWIGEVVHEEKGPDWVVQPAGTEGLKIFADYGMSLDVGAVFPNYLMHVPTLVQKSPNLKLIIDPLTKPPIDEIKMGNWVNQLEAVTQYPIQGRFQYHGAQAQPDVVRSDPGSLAAGNPHHARGAGCDDPEA